MTDLGRIAAIAAVTAIGAGGCLSDVGPARPQWVVVITTDAELPQFGDRLSIEVLTDSGDLACSSCRRQFAAADPTRWPISFGVVPPADGKPMRVHAQLFRSVDIGPEGSPEGDAFVEAVVTLRDPRAGSRFSLPLPMKCFGVRASVADRQSCDPATGMLAAEAVAPVLADADALEVNTWPPGLSVPCPADPPADMQCIPGGAFLLGDARTPSFQGPSYATTPVHLVQLSPFLLDRTEVTVQTLIDNPSLPEPDKADATNNCTYLAQGEGVNEKPVNCVSQSMAEAICNALGKRLPTEAEWEYAAGNLGAETPFPWGADDAHICDRAIVARGGIMTNQSSLCQVTDAGTLDPGPDREGSRDGATALGLIDLSGNVSEWTADAFSPYDQGYWASAPTLIKDPRCDSSPPEFTGQATARGASWQSRMLEARVTTRYSAPASAKPATIGVRCARSF